MANLSDVFAASMGKGLETERTLDRAGVQNPLLRAIMHPLTLASLAAGGLGLGMAASKASPFTKFLKTLSRAEDKPLRAAFMMHNQGARKAAKRALDYYHRGKGMPLWQYPGLGIERAKEILAGEQVLLPRQLKNAYGQYHLFDDPVYKLSEMLKHNYDMGDSRLIEDFYKTHPRQQPQVLSFSDEMNEDSLAQALMAERITGSPRYFNEAQESVGGHEALHYLTTANSNLSDDVHDYLYQLKQTARDRRGILEDSMQDTRRRMAHAHSNTEAVAFTGSLRDMLGINQPISSLREYIGSLPKAAKPRRIFESMQPDASRSGAGAASPLHFLREVYDDQAIDELLQKLPPLSLAALLGAPLAAGAAGYGQSR